MNYPALCSYQNFSAARVEGAMRMTAWRYVRTPFELKTTCSGAGKGLLPKMALQAPSSSSKH
eukprot:754678-Pelagomonas_calceolata.AAC.6